MLIRICQYFHADRILDRSAGLVCENRVVRLLVRQRQLYSAAAAFLSRLACFPRARKGGSDSFNKNHPSNRLFPFRTYVILSVGRNITRKWEFNEAAIEATRAG